MTKEEVFCPNCKTTMAISEGHFFCPNCGQTLTMKQAFKKKNRRKSRATLRLEELQREGRISL